MQNILAMERLDSKQQLYEPKSNDFLIQSLPILLQILDEIGEFSSCITLGLH